ncbi:hypothetical protein QBC43DRAFT_305290, partial [Cladorrhinum sp. PSN259]
MEPFTVLKPYKVLVYITCRHACTVEEINTHLRTKHRYFSVAERNAIVRTTQQSTSLFKNQAELEFLVLPQSPIPAVPDLAGPYLDGLKCDQCSYIARQVRLIQEHCRIIHAWSNPRTRGRNTAEKTRLMPSNPWRSGVPCQRFFPSRRASGWFEVVILRQRQGGCGHQDQDQDQDQNQDQEQDQDYNDDQDQYQDQDLEQDIDQSFVSTLLNNFNQAHRQTTTNIRNGEGKAEPNPWLRRVGWAEHLTGFDPFILYRTVSLETVDGWGNNTGTGISYDDGDGNQTTAGSAVLFEIGRKNIHTKPSTPFTSRLEPQTIQRYTNVWKRVVGFIFRTIDLDDSDRLPYKFQQHQTDALIQFRYYLSYTINTVSEQTEQTEGLTKALDRACLDFLITLLDQQLPHSSYDSVLLSALAVMGIRQDGGWLRPEEYTSIYSAIIKIARMLVVWQSQLEAEDTGPAEASVFALVRKKVSRFMTVVHEAGLPTPIDWIFDCRTYGLKVCFTTPASGQLYWVGSTVTYRQITFSMAALTEMLHQIVGELGRMVDQLTFRSFGILPLDFDWSHLYDDLGNNQVGFSFIKDPRNTKTLAGFESWLIQQIVKTQPLKTHWLVRQDGLRLRFRSVAIKSYLEEVDQFRELLLIAIYLLAGQPPRTTELIGLRHTNTAYGSLRNVFIQHRMVCLLFSYHKGYQLSGRTKVIYRYLPRELGDVVVRYFTIILPFCQQLQVQPDRPVEFSPFIWESQIVRYKVTSSDDDGKAQLWSSDKIRRILE